MGLLQIKKKVIVPTGEIYVAQGKKGLLEFLTVGDYGKDANIKADFLGIKREHLCSHVLGKLTQGFCGRNVSPLV